MKKILFYISVLFITLFLWTLPVRAENVVVVIDPGHGGDNIGGHYESFEEYKLTIQVAQYMKERLLQYDGIDVYLTRDGDIEKDISRSDRADFAKEKNADFLYSIHFNMSENHTYFGSEVWTSAFGEYYSKGQEFGNIMVNDLVEDLGFFNRGVKTRIGKTGQDYYGIIQSCVKLEIPAVIIEHCHLDEERDSVFLYQTNEPYKKLGYLDADAVAKYFRLSSHTLGVDYSDYVRNTYDIPSDIMRPDTTEPDYCEISLLETDELSGNAKIKINAADNDGYIQYYQLSTNGGKSYGKVYPWSENTDSKYADGESSVEININLEDKPSKLKVKVFNQYDLTCESNTIELPGLYKDEEITEQTVSDNSTDYSFDKPSFWGKYDNIRKELLNSAELPDVNSDITNKTDNYMMMVLYCIIAITVLMLFFFIIYLIVKAIRISR